MRAGVKCIELKRGVFKIFFKIFLFDFCFKKLSNCALNVLI